MKQSVRERIIFIRKVKDITQAELARKANVPRVLISQFERGIVELPVRDIQRIGKAMDVSPYYLIHGYEEVTESFSSDCHTEANSPVINS